MSDSAWRRALAGEFAAGYRDRPGVRAVLLSGSVARGLADRYSDIELLVVWADPPGDAARQDAVAAGGGKLLTAYEYDDENAEWSDDVLHSGVEIQVSHRTAAAVDQWITEVTAGFDPDLTKQDLIALIRAGVPLTGAALIERWRRQTEDYPAPLGDAMIRAHLDFRSAWQRRKLLDRQDLIPLYADLVDTARNVVLVLLGLNRTYFPHLGFKWIPALAADLAEAPPALADRLAAFFTAAPAEAVRTADALIEETLELVAARRPAVGAAEALAGVRQTRPVWAERPPRFGS